MNCLVCKKEVQIPIPGVDFICNNSECYYIYERLSYRLNLQVNDVKYRVEQLRKHEAIMEDYLLMKVDQKDWHGVQDAASDLRDIESELKGLKT